MAAPAKCSVNRVRAANQSVANYHASVVSAPTRQTPVGPIQDPVGYLESIIPKPADSEVTSQPDTKAQKNAASEETTITVTSGPTAITDKNRQDNTLAYSLATSIDQISNMDPVSALTGRELNNRGKTITEQIADFFKSIGNKIFRNGFGNVELGTYGIDSTIAHKPVNRARIVSVAAAPDVIRNGKQIGYNPNWKGRGYPSYIFAAPITVNGTTVYVAAVVDKNPDNKFYLSEMVDSEGNYVRIKESPSGNAKNGVTDGARESGKAGITARPEGLSEGDNLSAPSAEPTSLFNPIIRTLAQTVNPSAQENVSNSSAGVANQSVADYLASIVPQPARTETVSPVDTVAQTDYDNSQDVAVPDSMDIIDSVLKKGVGIKYNAGRSIKLSAKEYAAVTSRISTNYYYSNTEHEGVQCIERSTDGKNAKLYLYLYKDHGFGTYEIIGRIDYSQNDEMIRYLKEAINYGNQTDRTTEGISERIDRLQTVDEHPVSGRSGDRHGQENSRVLPTTEKGDEQRETGDKWSGRPDFDGHDDRGPGVTQGNPSVGATEGESYGPNAVGAAPGWFDPTTRLQYEYGTIPEGENPVRPDDLPKRDYTGGKVSYTARTVKGAEVTPDDFVDLLNRETVDGGLSYITITNNEATQAEPTVQLDTNPQTNYNNTTTSQGGNIYADGLQQNDRAGSSGDPAQGLAGVREADSAEPQRRNEHGALAVDSGIIRISEELQKAQSERGTPVYEMYSTTDKPDSYAKALEDGRNSDAENGWCVTPKSATELKNENVRTFLNADGTVGVGVKPDGDIVAVFKNRNGGPKRAMDTAMPVAIEQGGDRLDCYGEGLVGVYARYGFVPVARVEFNPEYANPGWTPGKGTPYIYFMMHNGDSAAAVVEKMGTYPEITKKQLDALPTYGKDSYDEAMAYRDSRIDQGRTTPPSAAGATDQSVADYLASIVPQPAHAETVSPVDTLTKPTYNGTRSPQATDVITRLNDDSSNVPSLTEIMAIPEIAAAEEANNGVKTIDLPNREQIREAGCQKAMQKGSWNGKDYSGEVRQEKRMDIVIGLPGSGKSSVYTERLSQEHKSRVIDTDDFRDYIPEYNGTNAAVVHEEASLMRGLAFDEAMDNGDNILLSTIGADAKKLAAQISGYKDEGYKVFLHLNELPNNKAIARAISRYISEDGSLGRYVSPELIARYGDKPTQTYLYLTGQGGTENGRLGKDIRPSGRYGTGASSQTSRTPGGHASAAAPADLLAGYDWYNNDVEKDQPPRLIQSSEHTAPSNAPANSFGDDNSRNFSSRSPNAVGAAKSQFEHQVERSNLYTNTYANATDPVSAILLKAYEYGQKNAGNEFSADRYTEMVSAGASDEAAKLVEAVMSGLTPEKDYAIVRPIQQLEAIMDMSGLSAKALGCGKRQAEQVFQVYAGKAK